MTKNFPSSPTALILDSDLSTKGYTNIVVKGGVCVMHGTKSKRCSVDGCTNVAKKGEIIIRRIHLTSCNFNPGDLCCL